MLKDRLRRVEMFGSLGVHPGEDLIDRLFRTVVLDCERMTSIDARFAVSPAVRPYPHLCVAHSNDALRENGSCDSALHVLLEVVRSYRARHIEPYFVRLNPFCTRAFEMAGIMAELGTGHVFDSVHDALAHGGHLRPNVAPAVTLL